MPEINNLTTIKKAFNFRLRSFSSVCLVLALAFLFITMAACSTESESSSDDGVFDNSTGMTRGDAKPSRGLTGEMPTIKAPRSESKGTTDSQRQQTIRPSDDIKWPTWGKPRDVTGRTGFEGLVVNLPNENGRGDFRVGKVTKVTTGYQSNVELPFDKGPKAKTPQRQKISTLLREKISSAQKGARADVVFNLKDDIQLKPFPKLGDVERGTSEYESALKSRLSVIDGLTKQRSEQAQGFLDSLGRRVSAKLIETNWVANTPVVNMELLAIPDVAGLDSVLFVSLNEGENFTEQGVDGDVDNDILDVRQQLRTDPYDKNNFRNGYIGVIDSGTRLTHDMLNDDPWDYAGDCANGGAGCWGDGGAPNGAAGASFPNYNVADCSPHGVPIIGGIAGSDDLGAELRGITRITTDSWRATTDSGCGSLPSSAITRAIQKSITSFNDVISNSYGGWPTNADGLSSGATERDNAYDLGLIVIASNGNYSCHAGADGNDNSQAAANRCIDAVTRSPAIQLDENSAQLSEPAFTTVGHSASAHKIISVGAHEVDPLCNSGGIQSNICSYSSRGPTADGRYKPDILGYTNYESANITADNTTRNMGGTSGAAPTIAAMAQMYNNWMEKGTSNASWLTPGHVYAALLSSGEHTTRWEGSYDYIGVEPGIAQLNIEGVGRPKMAVNGTGYIGSATMKKTGDVATINLNVPKDACGIKAAIWWPEDASQEHNDIDLLIKNQKGQVISAAMSGNSVWERASVSADTIKGLGGGTYQAQILGFDVNSEQPVYYFISVSTSGCWG